MELSRALSPLPRSISAAGRVLSNRPGRRPLSLPSSMLSTAGPTPYCRRHALACPPPVGALSAAMRSSTLRRQVVSPPIPRIPLPCRSPRERIPEIPLQTLAPSSLCLFARLTRAADWIEGDRMSVPPPLSPRLSSLPPGIALLLRGVASPSRRVAATRRHSPAREWHTDIGICGQWHDIIAVHEELRIEEIDDHSVMEDLERGIGATNGTVF